MFSICSNMSDMHCTRLIIIIIMYLLCFRLCSVSVLICLICFCLCISFISVSVSILILIPCNTYSLYLSVPHSVFDLIFVLYLPLNMSLFRVDSLDRFNKFLKD
ncbi:hypothetical protein HanPI659440_Chr13g0516651 [Helianthus annuus]|uniref:Uncharacterized protein n=1 Tax=Helianthus annuus TaxID=4232 RepID=A0A9K3EKN3_HELAN|nr:hypothetical protein HanXRQr2_Chr13g0608541 [Helianthus annuus]KAJ0478324.1 hypothetical protein HanHA300_Chr13g0498891 [Helianthus annuus]KAJ0483041.1 hypothetical protein HanIR_Chr13g0660541 [Helianthus annuus]KAJ0499208.1 hypothetical protein HanHA89_Chr13g0531551 [Helianthus annuus]KAJ0665224.1 hypothetical protein HanLR1_Chr13g0501601 [Helianthus annuus]